MYNYPYMRPGILSRLFGTGFSWSSFLDGTQKTLGVINQAIPIVNQVKPIVSNARTIFKIADEIKKPTTSSVTNQTLNSSKPISTNKPIFYI